MDETQNIFLKMIKNYDRKIKNRIKYLDNKINTLQSQIKEREKKYCNTFEIKQKLERHNSEINKKYNYLLNILKSRGIIFEISVVSTNINEWDNLYIKILKNIYYFADKNNEIIYEIDSRYFSVVEHIIKNYKYSILVIRKDAYLITLQLRILDSIHN
ncbi:MAG: hypothetical protein LKF87_02800 [Clostridium tyrobutyricum]|jgi:hypothetical protein|uniref:Uncharacterized protein n=1 Tax=Clostridium tyrobutyricum DIVETGP TaxID=1408889 RepID=W6NLA4_CLOTY|nr:hypothetical protein [Clostridium tyrobutyricum]AND84537.1 hypothetical protein CTK_C12760 [Clostridium tyrobutyricum]ANP69149.1 hypothetical protein BA182_05510 [Clostridium tyrobutyricum]MBV4433463.1 hypothetical protein [Clostridium tyrobutyricum]MBV4447658.1 hypothetical protein [Clostridium tyrobutyricum]MCH4200036.1 hypothetical protein [Clostridium tyrobutyricum]